MRSLIEMQPAMSLEQLQETGEWAALTPKQRLWIRSFLESKGDALMATRLSYAAYAPKPDRYVQMFAPQVKNHPSVQAVLNLYFGRTERDERKEFFDAIQRKILKGNKLSIADRDAIKLLCAERGWAVLDDVRDDLQTNGRKPVSQQPKTFAVGDKVFQDGVPYRVKSVDASGKILAADPWESSDAL